MNPRNAQLLQDVSTAQQTLSEALDIDRTGSSGVDAYVFASLFQERAMNALIGYSESLRALSSTKPVRDGQAKNTGQKSEDRAHEVLVRFAERYGPRIGNEYPWLHDIESVDIVLSDIISRITTLLDRGANRIGRIYSIPPRDSMRIIAWDGSGLEAVKTAPKYVTLMRILLRRSVKLEDIAVTIEDLDNDQMRSIPYRIVHVRDSTIPSQDRIRTICVSDEIGEQTFVYDGFVDLTAFRSAEKGKPVQGISVQWVRYGDDYEMKLEDRIYGVWEAGERKEQGIQHERSTIAPEDPLSEMVHYQSQILAAEPELAQAGIVPEGGIWYFGDAKGVDSWPKVSGKKLVNFPSLTLNKKYGLGNERGVVQNPLHLSRMFQKLWLRVATEEEEVARWGGMLVDAEPELAQAGIIQENGIWYFGDAKGRDFWPKVGGRNLKNFPNAMFNKRHGLGSERGAIFNSNELSRMFQKLWLRTAISEEECVRKEKEEKITHWGSMLVETESELAQAGIIQKNGIWYFGDAKGCDSWPKVDGRNLKNFPNAMFNKKYGLGSEWGEIFNSHELSRMFQKLWLRVAIKEEEVARWGGMLVDAEPELAQAGITKKNGIWYFGDVKQFSVWPKVDGRNLMNFPNAVFNKKYGLGNERGVVQNPLHLSHMFQKLWHRVATEEEETARWGGMLVDAEPELARVGIIQKNGIWYFGDANGVRCWPKVGGKDLKNFPNAAFHKKYELGNKNGMIVNASSLSQMFVKLWLRVATSEEEHTRKALLTQENAVTT